MADDKSTNISRDEVFKLPRWARVAFAARCARRVQPLFVSQWPDTPDKHVQGVDNAITIAERSAHNARAAVGGIDATAFAADAVRVADDATIFAKAAAYAADTARAAATAALTVDDGGAASAAAHAANAALSAAVLAARGSVYTVRASIQVGPQIRRDFELLSRLADSEKWTDCSPVPPEVFGPLWPDGEPHGWPWWKATAANPALTRATKTVVQSFVVVPQVKTDVSEALASFASSPRFSLVLDPGDATKEEVQELFEALNDMHVAAGGLGLEFRLEDLYVCAREGVVA
jgi:hypothetical protein